jgi:preprotein translocase subunit SecD
LRFKQEVKKGNIVAFLFILALFVFSLWVILPVDSNRFGRQGFSLGLDLKGGSYIVYQADLTQKDPSQTDEDAMNGVFGKIERRANAFGVTEPVIQRQGTDRILLQLPGIKNVDEAKKAIGQVAELDFKEVASETAAATPGGSTQVNWQKAMGIGKDGKEKALTGKYLKPKSQVIVDQQTSKPEVAFEWDEEGAMLFEQVTKRNLNKPLGIFLDNELISAPTVQSVIKERGVITGVDLEEARRLAIQLNSGSLDVPLKIIQEQDVDATLGSDSIQKSLLAGAIGAMMIILFMILYYRLSGLVACIALVFYTVLLLAIFKLIPITLTLPGVAAFIVSLGMAVDANVLIFERMKDELRSGRTVGAAVESGFSRAWPAIRDSNVTTFIACIILAWFGSTMGAFMVSGFAITLFIGVALSMFSAIIISRSFLRFTIQVVKTPSAYGVWK